MPTKEKKFEKGLRIYNLFPRLVGPIAKWGEHIPRIKQMGFNCLFLNPFHLTGSSGSLYAIKDYDQIAPSFLSSEKEDGWKELRAFIQQVKDEGLLLTIDLVINHTSSDNELTTLHPEWYKHDQDSHIQHPFCIDPGNSNKITVWRDLAEIDNGALRARENGLWAFWAALIEKYIDLGIDGFRCDAAYKIPHDLWGYLIENAHKKHPRVLFLAETLGCSEEETIRTAKSGFDYIYNSSKWWDLSADWCLRQYEMARQFVGSISFPETHDTLRFCQEVQGNIELCKMRYLLAALFSKGLMIPIGYEYGFLKPLHVVNTTPEDWETGSFDLVDFITRCNKLKDSYQIFNEEAEQFIAPISTYEVLILERSSLNSQEKAALFINKTGKEQKVIIGNTSKFLNTTGKIRDISIDKANKKIPSEWEIILAPYQIKILYASNF